MQIGAAFLKATRSRFLAFINVDKVLFHKVPFYIVCNDNISQLEVTSKQAQNTVMRAFCEADLKYGLRFLELASSA